jgi:molecular chaperone GrpE
MEKAESSKPAVVEPDTEKGELNADVRREHDLYLRVLADFENFRRRVDRDRVQTAASGKRELLLSLLEVLDGFDRALPYLNDLNGSPESVAQGIHAIHRRFIDLLKAQQVTAFKAVGEVFDPALHEAIGEAQSEGHPPGTVVEEVQRGYRLGEDLLRPARVRVAT